MRPLLKVTAQAAAAAETQAAAVGRVEPQRNWNDESTTESESDEAEDDEESEESDWDDARHEAAHDKFMKTFGQS